MAPGRVTPLSRVGTGSRVHSRCRQTHPAPPQQQPDRPAARPCPRTSRRPVAPRVQSDLRRKPRWRHTLIRRGSATLADQWRVLINAVNDDFLDGPGSAQYDACARWPDRNAPRAILRDWLSSDELIPRRPGRVIHADRRRPCERVPEGGGSQLLRGRRLPLYRRNGTEERRPCPECNAIAERR